MIVTVGSGASRRAAAEQFEVSASAAVKWLHCWQVDGRSVAKPRGGSTSPLEEHKEWLLGIIGEQPDMTLDEVVAAMRKEKIASSRSAVCRFFARHKMIFKKKPARSGAGAGRRGAGAAALASRAMQT